MFHSIIYLGEISLLAYAKQKYEAHKAVCANQSLRSHYQCNEPAVPLNLTCWYLYQMSLGLKYLHDNGYTHGDIKRESYLIQNVYEVPHRASFVKTNILYNTYFLTV